MKNIAIGISLIFLLLGGFSGLFLGGAMLGIDHGRRAEKEDAVKAGAGKWTIDPATGERFFIWTPELKGQPK